MTLTINRSHDMRRVCSIVVLIILIIVSAEAAVAYWVRKKIEKIYFDLSVTELTTIAFYKQASFTVIESLSLILFYFLLSQQTSLKTSQKVVLLIGVFAFCYTIKKLILNKT